MTTTDLMEGFRLLIAELVRKELAKQGGPASADEFISTRKAAGYANVAPGTIRRWIRERRLEPFGAGRQLRVRRADLDRLLTDGGRRVKRIEESPEAKADRYVRERFGR